MGIWILLAAIVISDSSGGGVSMINQEFTSQQRCEDAKKVFMAQIDSDKVSSFSNKRAVCVQK